MKSKLNINWFNNTFIIGIIVLLAFQFSISGCFNKKKKIEPSRFASVDEIVEKGIKDSIYPGAVLMIGNKNGIIYEKAYGGYDYSKNAIPMQTATIFDLASVTKVMATTNAVMKLYEEGKINLDVPVAHYIPHFAQNGKAHVTIRNLLLHNSGLPPGRPFYKFCKTPKEALDSLYAMPLSYKTGAKTVYSDLGFITLGKVVEIVSGTPLDKFMEKTFYQPMGMKSTMFNPPGSLWPNIAPTEIKYNFRLTKASGKVRNKNTQLMNGVAGHAGLFSSAEDLSEMAMLYLNNGIYKGKRYLKKSTIHLFTKRQEKENTRGLGWDTENGSGKTRTGNLFSHSAFGHTGHTGTAIWMDPEQNIFIIFLTNRTYGGRDDYRMYKFRPDVFNSIIKVF